MGNCCGGDKVGPSEQNQFGYDVRIDDIKRRPTDTLFLTLFAVFLVIFLGFLGYCILHGDLHRVINGYDDCGYICGQSNPISKDAYCSESDKTSKKYHILDKPQNEFRTIRKCVAECPDGYNKLINRCIPRAKNMSNLESSLEEFVTQVTEDFQVYWKEFCYLCLIALGMSFLMLVLFRLVVGVIVWIVLVGVVLACIGGTAFLWLLWKDPSKFINQQPSYFLPDLDERNSTTFLVFAIISSVLTVIVVLIIVVMRKRINLVIKLFEEAGKAIAAMPILLLQPVMTFVALGGVACLWVYFTIWIQSSGWLQETKSNSHIYRYIKDGIMKGTMWYNIFAALWMVQFIIGCQHMIIAGAVAMWYFRKRKSVNFPVFVSFYNLTRYHLGSVALGSFLIALVQFARLVLESVKRTFNNREGKIAQCVLSCCQCCLYIFERFLKFFTRNAYIEVAMYGYSFCAGGAQAFKQIASNVLNVVAINSVGDFVLFLGKVAVVVATVFIGVRWMRAIDGVQHIWVPITLAGIFAYFVAHCFITVFEMIIDTIFLCFCEDCEKNDGVTRPYCMSRGLMEFVQNSGKALNIRDVPRLRSPQDRGSPNTVSHGVVYGKRNKEY
ncbi:unnamed protein product [Acanthoscelides obtectus]|nr:unnamed protein product [Acanthoscelides obtectus]CAK1646340.1 Choline transporter-like protein 1 [Acanthoscelides obtectus]